MHPAYILLLVFGAMQLAAVDHGDHNPVIFYGSAALAAIVILAVGYAA